MSLQLVPNVLVKDFTDGKSKLIICKHIPYVMTPSEKDAGHVVSIFNYINGTLCHLGRVETFASGIRYIQTLNKDHLLEVS
jgi:hypothetical protein